MSNEFDIMTRLREWTSLNDSDILEASRSVLSQLKGKFKWTKRPERLIQYYLYGYFIAKGIPMTVEYPAQEKFIDFRYDGDNKALLELEKIISTKYDYEGLPKNNESELLKLTRHTRGQAKRRILLILDFRDRSPAPKQNLQEAYEKRWEKLRKKLTSVTVWYVHHSGKHFSFSLKGKRRRR